MPESILSEQVSGALGLDGFDRGGFQHEAAVTAFRQFLLAFGLPPDSELMRNTPRRVVDAYAEIFTPPPFEATIFENERSYDEQVIVRNIAFRSICEHHFLPFTGTVSISYLPASKIIGLSKLARCVERMSSRPQLQERLTAEIADWIEEALQPRGVGVRVSAAHMCMTLRGVRSSGSSTVTTAFRGRLRDDSGERASFLDAAHD